MEKNRKLIPTWVLKIRVMSSKLSFNSKPYVPSQKLEFPKDPVQLIWLKNNGYQVPARGEIFLVIDDGMWQGFIVKLVKWNGTIIRATTTLENHDVNIWLSINRTVQHLISH